ncbi:MAG: transposase, partial [Rubrobacter sp.]|nr:transposase [Rubrobacter sp.]
KIAGVTDALSKVRVGKDAVSRIARRLEEQQKEWRERSLGEKEYAYLYLDATYLKVRCKLGHKPCHAGVPQGWRQGAGSGGGYRLWI